MAPLLKSLVLALAFIAASDCTAKPTVPTSVRTVISGGWWANKGVSGNYRVLIVDEGWEHIWSHLVIEWIARPEFPESDPKVLTSVAPELPWGKAAVLDAKILRTGPGRMEILVSATTNGMLDPHDFPKPVQIRVIATTPGSARVIGNTVK